METGNPSHQNCGKRSQQHRRTKRGKYVKQACTECKRRKVKCDGTKPTCANCAKLKKSCEYLMSCSVCFKPVVEGFSFATPPTAPKALTNPVSPATHSHIVCTSKNTVEEAIVTPQQSANLCPNHYPTGSLGVSPEFCGPSSSEFTLNVVSGSLQAMGLPSTILQVPNFGRGSPIASPFQLANYGPILKLLTIDPLWELEREDAILMVDKWFDFVGSLYPVVRRDAIMTTLERVYACLEPIKHNPCLQGRSATAAAATLFNNDTDKLKIVIAIGRTLDTGGKDDQAQRLFQSTTGSVEDLLWNSNGISGIQLLVLAALYHHHLDEEVRTGRIIGFAARLCLEMGLHRRLTIDKTFPNTSDRLIALEAFSSVYMLERRTGLGQGIPYTIQDSYIDPALFTMDDANPMLHHLLKWTRLAGKTWQALNSNGENGVEMQVENLDYLDFMIKKWYHELPDNLKLDVVQLARSDTQRGSTYHQAIFLLQQDHLRNLIFRPVLQSASRITQHERHASSAVEIAQNSIMALSALYKNTHLVTSHPLFFKHLLLTAFLNLLLSVVHACRVFWPVVREEFDSALDLIEQLSGQSAPMMRLWQRVCGLRELPKRLDQTPRFDECGPNDSASALNPEFVLSLEEFFPGLSTKLSLPVLDLAQLVEYNSDATGPRSGSAPPLGPSITGNHFGLPLVDYQFPY